MNFPEIVMLEMVDYNEFRICCRGEWQTVRKGDFGFIDLTKTFPVIRTVHSMICECKLKE